MHLPCTSNSFQESLVHNRHSAAASSSVAVSKTGIRRFNKFNNKLMLDDIEPQLVGKMFYELFRGNNYKLVQELNYRNVYLPQHLYHQVQQELEKNN